MHMSYTNIILSNIDTLLTEKRVEFSTPGLFIPCWMGTFQNNDFILFDF